MTATDILRAMLDERGVEWWPSDDPCCEDIITHWRVGQIQWTAIEGEKDLWLNAGIAGYEPFTPAQAIAATLGVESDTSEYERNVDGSYKCPICGCVVDYDVRGDDERIITMDDYVIPFNFCPKCGRRIIDQDARDLRDAIATDDGKRYSMQEVMDLMEGE